MTSQKQSQPGSRGDAPKVLRFEGSPEQVERGSAVTLSWTLGGGAADKVLLDGVAVQGSSCTRKPVEDPTIYTLVVTNAAGSDTHEAVVGVHESGDVVSGEFVALAVDDEPPKQQRIHLQLQGDGGQLGARKYTLEIDGETQKGTTDADGVIDALAPAGATRGKLTVYDDADGGPLELELRFGPMPPVSELEGVQARLSALGYYPGASGQLDDDTKAALREFQEQHLGQEPTGELDAATRRALQAAYPG